ncbi:MAG: hypothetical protein LBH08_00150 [Puniceicoccales bacterium]|jgi:beta-lactamase superfamily II metal-dependent hydrolase|nr:hypothetical protein [Puniceicoccales bacterium]
MEKKHKWIRIIFRCLYVVAYCWGVPLWADLDMYVYNVGQANCILVTIGNATGDKSAIFFDTGIQRKINFDRSSIQAHIADVITNESIRNIWFILSHTDDDHINIFEEIAQICNKEEKPINGVIVGTDDIEVTRNKRNTQIVKIRTTDGYKNSTAIVNLCQIIRKFTRNISITSGRYAYKPKRNKFVSDRNNQCFNAIHRRMNAILDQVGTGIEFLWPKYEHKLQHGQLVPYNVTNANEASLVTILTYAGRSILFTGDAPGKLFHSICFEKRQINGKWVTVPRMYNVQVLRGIKNMLQNVDILICPHHGSMSNGSYRWRGELNHPQMISIVSSNPTGPHKLPERSFMDHTPLVGMHFDPHVIAYCSKLSDSYSYRWTCAPIFVTGCSGIPPIDKLDQESIQLAAIQSSIDRNTGIGYHVNISSEGEINVKAMMRNDPDDSFQEVLISLGTEDIESEEVVVPLDQSFPSTPICHSQEEDQLESVEEE